MGQHIDRCIITNNMQRKRTNEVLDDSESDDECQGKSSASSSGEISRGDSEVNIISVSLVKTILLL